MTSTPRATGVVLTPDNIRDILDRGTRIPSAIAAAADWIELDINGWHSQQIDRGHDDNLGGEHRTGFCRPCADAHQAVGLATYTIRRRTAGIWRRTIERHVPKPIRPMFPQDEFDPICAYDGTEWPCAHITDTADEVRAWIS